MCQRLLMRFCPICLMMERRSKVAGNEPRVCEVGVLKHKYSEDES